MPIVRPGEEELPSHAVLKKRILADIPIHIQTHGRSSWDLIRENPSYAHVIGKAAGEAGRRKFWRWVNAVSEPPRPDTTRPHEARATATDALTSATACAVEAARHLPAAPPPSYLMRAGADAANNIDFLTEVHVIYADAVRLRDEAMEPDEEAPSGARIRDPKFFDRSIARRLDVIKAVVEVMEKIWDLEHQQRFNDAVYDIIVNELAGVPDIRQRVIEKLKELNNRSGMTVHAGGSR